MGSGLYEQMEVANTIYYDVDGFSLDLLQNALYELCAAKLDFGNRHFIIKTGERGAIQFHKAVSDTLSGWGVYHINADALGMVNKTTNKVNDVSLAAGYQYTEYRMPNGVVVSIDVDPYYDDPVRNKVMCHKGGPAFSYRYDIFDIGTMNQPNIFKCKVRGEEEVHGYQWGLMF